jgi:hypothetical protein
MRRRGSYRFVLGDNYKRMNISIVFPLGMDEYPIGILP